MKAIRCDECVCVCVCQPSISVSISIFVFSISSAPIFQPPSLSLSLSLSPHKYGYTHLIICFFENDYQIQKELFGKSFNLHPHFGSSLAKPLRIFHPKSHFLPILENRMYTCTWCTAATFENKMRSENPDKVCVGQSHCHCPTTKRIIKMHCHGL